MTKSDLKSGMIIKNREGRISLVMLGTPAGDALVGDGRDRNDQTWKPLNSINKDLTSDSGFDDDIIEVWSYSYNSKAANLSTSDRTLLWKRKDLELKLNDGYTAIIDKKNNVVKVGCQEFSFDIIEKLHDMIN